MDIEEIFINLKVLENLDKNQKLISRGQYLNIEPVSLIPEFVRRWHRQDNRNETIKKLNLIVNSAIDYIIKHEQPNKINNTTGSGIQHSSVVTENTVNDDAKQKDYPSLLITLKQPSKSEHKMTIYLENALNGIKNLKETYATCSQTCARLDVIINKIQHVLNYEIKDI